MDAKSSGSQQKDEEPRQSIPPSGLGFGVWGLGFGVQGLGFGVQGFGIWGLGFGV